MSVKVGLIDVDGHNFPNLAQTKLSAHYKSRGTCRGGATCRRFARAVFAEYLKTKKYMGEEK